MNVNASPLVAARELSLGAVLALLAPHEGKALVIVYGGREIQAGYHVTEVKAGSFVTLDCGGNPDAWQETILQVEDIPAAPGQAFMPVARFLSILKQVDRKVRLDYDARLTIEIGPPATPMQIFDVEGVAGEGDRAILRLAARAAICKPRHRTHEAANVACCGPAKGRSSDPS